MGACTAKHIKEMDSHSCQTDAEAYNAMDPYSALVRTLSSDRIYKQICSELTSKAPRRVCLQKDDICSQSPGELITQESKNNNVDSGGDHPSLSDSKGSSDKKSVEHTTLKSVQFNPITVVREHVYCDDSSPEAASKFFDTNQSNAFRNCSMEIVKPTLEFYVNDIASQVHSSELCDEETKEKSTSSTSSDRPTQLQYQYTFYIPDDATSCKPFQDRRIPSIASRFNCKFQLFTKQSNEKPLFFKGNRVRPVTIWSHDMISLKRCLAQIDNKYPNFNARAFLRY